MPYRRIEINFPVDVKIDKEHFKKLNDVVSAICKDYVREHPDRVMWPFGQGFKMTVHPMMLSDDEPIPFDESCYEIEVAEREK